MPKHIFENEEPRDEPTTALIGTLAHRMPMQAN